MNKQQEILNKTFAVVRSKNTRNITFLILSVFFILLINSLLPIIEGSAHYTEDPIEVTYKEYKEMLNKDANYSLTWTSQVKIEKYIIEYCLENPDITIEQRVDVEPPDTFKVNVYTKFFFSYTYWWLSTLTHIVSVLLVYYSVFNYLLSKRKRTEQRYLELTEEINKAGNESLDPVTFEPWIEKVFNKERKIKQHIANTKYNLDRLLHKTNYKIRHGEGHSPRIRKKHEEYLIKVKTLEEQLEPWYLENYVPNNKVKSFNYIYPTFVLSGYNTIGRSVDSYSLLRSDSKRLGRDGVRKILVSMLLTTMFAILLTFTVGTSIDKPWYWIVINVVVKLAPMLMQIPLAYDYCDVFMESQLITNLLSRRSIILLYLAYMEQGGALLNGPENKSEDRPTDTITVGGGDLEQRDST